MVLNLLNADENVDVPLTCPATKKPQQIVAARPRNINRSKVHTHIHSHVPRENKGEQLNMFFIMVFQGKQKKPSRSHSRNIRGSCQVELSDQEAGATHFSGSTHSYERYDSLPSSL